MGEIILAYITNPNKKEAEKLARLLLEKRLIACANIIPITSLYWWQGKITKDREFLLIGKTIKKKFQRLKKFVEEVHPYSVPCILKLRASSNDKYYEWLKKELR